MKHGNSILTSNIDFVIEEIRESSDILITELVDLTFNIVQGGASIGFMDDLTVEQARIFWSKVLNKVKQQKTVLIVAKNSVTNQITGTVQLQIDLPSNQAHRADVAKMLVHSDFRRMGIAQKLLQQIEKIAIDLKKTLLVLDTVTDSPAYLMYQKCGWTIVGDIPNYALLPNGLPCSTTYFYKNLNNSAEKISSPQIH
ncbi:MAG: GNAT family N-acetyltransferase [Sphingobacterium sp.]|jgi:ribosomal protein S18 acetylase RimI-like enzyme|uniref:GNAT family N-acetyltransferase n=1 Tax=Sphingobacterium sp. TaxID=341027 RepID=UPI00283F965C|nr:GNAT family N-acetyltransferase [Sphingobacterium sp.]MDR3007710.1 GNAT family N-acetyltransferase [Sphingobacterium sp.]